MPQAPPPLPAQLEGHIDCLLIDNFDSFTWNLYQSLCLIGTVPVVIRNNILTAAQLPLLSISSLIISPGPGHPKTDSGISRDAIKYFAGKVPVLGVCMGLECIVDCFGGEISYAGEIMHGKTSPIIHDARGCMHGIPQHFNSTRYHSLSAHVKTLPKELMICAVTEESGVVMGVRHRELTVEAVQYHPESCMSEGGEEMLKNFLSLKGGKWDENKHLGVKDLSLPPFEYTIPAPAPPPSEKVNGEASPAPAAQATMTAQAPPSILVKITTQRLADVQVESSTPGSTVQDIKAALELGLAPPAISFIARLREGISEAGDNEEVIEGSVKIVPTPRQPTQVSASQSQSQISVSSSSNIKEASHAIPAVLAEIKRASPSKGNLSSATLHAPTQALVYALGGASAISVLTETRHFKGTLEDLKLVRAALDKCQHRPAVLRKDFIIHPYQLYASRLAGADTVLLIVSSLPAKDLRELYDLSIQLGMEPLVEVNNPDELTLALALPPSPISGGIVIGVNNRNLNNFHVDMSTTSRMAAIIKEEGRDDVILCALSGISNRGDVTKYTKEGVRGMLVGESLMKSPDPAALIRELLGKAPLPQAITKHKVPLVKVCGITSVDDALAAAKEGADMIGMVFVAGSKRSVSLETARAISMAVRDLGEVSNEVDTSAGLPGGEPAEDESQLWFARHASILERARKGSGRPLVVGVFQNSPLPEVQHFARVCMLDLVQLHGSEPVEWGKWISGSGGVGVIKVFHVPAAPEPESKPEPVKEENGGADAPARTAEPAKRESATASPESLAEIRRTGYHNVVLLDSIPRRSPLSSTTSGQKTLSGGSGVPMDWSYARSVVEAGEVKGHPMPLMLAGGLKPENAAVAVETARPWCVDVSSGVEYGGEKGIGKDHQKIRAFIRAAKGLDVAEPAEAEQAPQLKGDIGVVTE